MKGSVPERAWRTTAVIALLAGLLLTGVGALSSTAHERVWLRR